MTAERIGMRRRAAGQHVVVGKKQLGRAKRSLRGDRRAKDSGGIRGTGVTPCGWEEATERKTEAQDVVKKKREEGGNS